MFILIDVSVEERYERTDFGYWHIRSRYDSHYELQRANRKEHERSLKTEKVTLIPKMIPQDSTFALRDYINLQTEKHPARF